MIDKVANPNPGYDNTRYYAIHITASQFLEINRAMLRQALRGL